MIFIKIVSNRNKKYFKQYRFYPSSDNSFIPTVVFYDTKCALCLNGSVHPQKCSLDTFKIFNHFLMHHCKFVVDPNGTVFICFFTSFCVWTARAVFTLIYFFLTSILVPFYIFTCSRSKFLSYFLIFFVKNIYIMLFHFTKKRIYVFVVKQRFSK